MANQWSYPHNIGNEIQRKNKLKTSKRRYNFEDTGQVTIEHFVQEKAPDDAPFLFIIHTMGEELMSLAQIGRHIIL